MQAKDIPEQPVLGFLAGLTRWATWGTWAKADLPTVAGVMPPNTPEKVQRAKMAALIRRGLVDGCPCGCRGDYRITDKGREVLRTYR